MVTKIKNLPVKGSYRQVSERLRPAYKLRRPGLPIPKLQAPVYDILPSTTAVFNYAIGSRKLSANEQFLVGAQTIVSLLQTTQIKQGVSFIAANKVYTSTTKPQSPFESRRYSFFHPAGWMRLSHVHVRAWALGCFHSLIRRTFRRVLTASLDSCAEIKSAPSVA